MTAAAGIRFRSAVLANGMYRLLFLATLGSGVGTWMATIALTLDVQVKTHSSTWWVSLLFVVTFLPSVVVGAAIGPLIDRLSRKRLIIGADLARVLVFALLPFADTPAATIALATVAGIANSFFRPAVLAGVPNLVSGKDLDAATSLLQGTDWFAAALGPLIGGTLVSGSGPHLVYWINAGTFLFSALLLARIPGRLLQSAQGITRGHWRDLREGLDAFRGWTPLRLALYGFAPTMVAQGVVYVAEVFLAKRVLHSGAFGFGLLYAASGVGLVAGSIVTGIMLERRDVLGVYTFTFVPIAAGLLGAAVAPDIWVAAAAMVVAGFGNGLAFPMMVLIIQRHTSDRVRGRAFTVVISIHTALLGLAIVASGALTEGIGARWTYVLGSACAAASAVTVIALSRGLGRAPALTGEPAA